MRKITAVVVVIAAGFALLGAQSAEPAGAKQTEESQVQAVLGEYLAAIRERSCPRLIAVSARISNQRECENELHEFSARRAELTGISKLVRDGRSRHDWLATATLNADGRERSIVLRVMAERRGWKVRA
jgi:hypothetical protein